MEAEEAGDSLASEYLWSSVLTAWNHVLCNSFKDLWDVLLEEDDIETWVWWSGSI